ncbi:MAG: GNAT family N-acetyltransferase [Gemmatimonadales bacterium]|nr:GNAT family N-acetyltransferase [Gemmatimonadales bacterium]
MLLRPLSLLDTDVLARRANDPEVARHLTDAFPHPYTREHAVAFIGTFGALAPPEVLVIEHEGEFAGCIGVHPQADVWRRTAKLGYWVARPFWGRGLATAAVRERCRTAYDDFDLERLEASVFSSNPASMRVLEKAGFTREGVHRRAVVKWGEVLDEVVYARLRP